MSSPTQVGFKEATESFERMAQEAEAKRQEELYKLPFYKQRPYVWPEIEDLESLWPFVMANARALEAQNPDDPYFKPLHRLEAFTQGRRIDKNLFEVDYFLKNNPMVIGEIGCRTGQSLVNKMALHDFPLLPAVIAFDAFIEQGSPEVVLKNMGHMGLGDVRVLFMVGNTMETLPGFADGLQNKDIFDYFLVDGSHEPEVAENDLRCAVDLIKPGGVLGVRRYRAH